MNIEAIPIGGKRKGIGESDIFRISLSKEGLVIFVEAFTKSAPVQNFEIYFQGVSGYRYLDEGDLQRYDNCEVLREPYCVYEIISGGWSNGETVESGVLDTSKAVGIREWFVATTNGCLNVLSNAEPAIKNL
jgi:hypothetical protein